ncbi:MAG: hypothetical protein IJT18_05385 [Oscillospiraceae bacterium]|nr:hypothetical protein [Oscillospiraceae bacterium]
MDRELLLENILRIDAENTAENVLLTDAKIIAFLLDHCEITVPQEASFFVRVNCERLKDEVDKARRKRLLDEATTEQLRLTNRRRAYRGNRDFGHTAPDWDAVTALGIPGLKRRATEQCGDLNPDFAEAETLVWDAAERFCLRCADAAEKCGKPRMAQSLRAQTEHAPENLFEVMQLTLVYYALQQFFEATLVRTLGRLDRMFLPFYRAGEDEDLFEAYIRELDSIKPDANMPFTLGGSSVDGTPQVNAVSYRLLETYAALQPADVKMHILCTPDMPRDFLRLAMRSVRDGGNSIIFLNDAVIIEGLCRLGETVADATDYGVVGCYEPCGKDEVPCSCNAIVSIPKALELALHHGCDGLTGDRIGPETAGEFADFEALYREFERQLAALTDGAVRQTGAFEAIYPKLHAAPFFSSTMATCVLRGGDVYCDASAKYNNSSLNAIGIATAADSLAAIRKLVWEDGTLTLPELIRILDDNWEGQELLRATVRNRFPKFGNNDPAVDALAQRILAKLSDMVNGRPNERGGVYRLGIFSIDWRVPWGEGAAASADGRKAGETLSQNATASFGADREGATAHILSITSLDAASAVNGAIMDLDLHISACRGEDGLEALLATLTTFMQRGGEGVHYNVLNTETLEAAQKYPERYQNLQVRLCGWNERFLALSLDAQNEFIRRSKHQAG